MRRLPGVDEEEAREKVGDELGSLFKTNVKALQRHPLAFLANGPMHVI